jgi:hypothetical protein
MKMRSSSKSSKTVTSKGMCCPAGEAREKYRDYNPLPVNPLKHQFAPTPAEPVNQHKQMAGC